MIIDAHQHVWDLTRSSYAWLGPQVPQWNRTFTFEELLPHLRRNGVDATVLVQSDDQDADTDLMLEVAERHPEVAAIVAYVPLDRPDRAAERLAELRKDRAASSASATSSTTCPTRTGSCGRTSTRGSACWRTQA